MPVCLAACITVALCIPVPQVIASDDISAPWSVNDSVPVIAERAVTVSQASSVAGGDSLGAMFCYGWLRFYQCYLPAVVRSTCPMYPSCSQFSILAIVKHGSFWGIAMTADRLMREVSETRISPMVYVGGRFRCFDPVDNNDFWWSSK